MRSQDEAVRRLIAEQAAQWHVENLQGELSPQRSREFMRWLRTSPVHVAEYLTVAGIAQELAVAAQDSRASLEDLLAAGHNQPARLPVTEGVGYSRKLSPGPHRVRRRQVTPSRHAGRGKRLRRGGVAAMLALVCLVVFLTADWFAMRPDVHTYVAQHGQVRSVELPDGSAVKLDSDSALTVRFDGARRRLVLDRGRVYFKVVDDPRRPFSVRVGDSLIRDIGTTFEVYRHKVGVTVTVATGHVQVWHASDAEPSGRFMRWLPWSKSDRESEGTALASLGPQGRVRIGGNGQVQSMGTVDVSRALAWMRGRIAFDDQTVAAVAAEFNRYNDVQIKVADRSVGQLRITGAFESHSVKAFVTFLSSLPDVQVQKHGHIVMISSRHGRNLPRG